MWVCVCVCVKDGAPLYVNERIRQHTIQVRMLRARLRTRLRVRIRVRVRLRVRLRVRVSAPTHHPGPQAHTSGLVGLRVSQAYH